MSDGEAADIDWPEGDPDNEPSPADRQELPSILELDLETEPEKMFSATQTLDTRSVVRQFSLPTNPFLSCLSPSLSPLICLRI